MKPVRLIAVALAFVSLNACSSRKEATSAEKIVGTWEVTKPGKSRRGDASFETPSSTVLKFTSDGKLIWTARINDLPGEIEGEYKVEGDKIVATRVLGPEGDRETVNIKIKTLTDTTLVTEYEDGHIDEFTKK